MKLFIILIVSFFTFNTYAQYSIELSINVINDYTSERISYSYIRLINLNTNRITRKKTDFNGEIKLFLSPNMNYRLYVGYDTDTTIVLFKEKFKSFNTTGILEGNSIETIIKLRPTFKQDGLKFLGDINFGLNSSELDEIALAKLDNAIQLMKNNLQIKLFVEGYSSCNVSDEEANNISVSRATSVFTYLTDRNIDYTRIKANAWGKTKTITKCVCDDSLRYPTCANRQHLKNSRVSLTFSNIK